MQYSSRSENYSSSLRDSPSKWGSGNKENKGYAYKQASYQYSSSNNNNNLYSDKRSDKNIDQLDALLEDLRNEREVTRDRDHSLNYRTIDRSTNEDALDGTVTKTTRVVKTSKHAGGLDDIEILPSSDFSTLRSNGSLVRSDYQTFDKSYGSRNLSPGGGFYETKKTKVYESNRSLNKTSELGPVVSETIATTADIQEDLKNITINEDILPVPGTKVTTTVRTYTYEIPANGVIAPTTSNTLNRKNVSYNTLQTNETNNVVHPHPVHTIPQTVVYNTESYSTLNKGKPVVNNQSYEVREHYESNTSRNNTLPLQPRSPPPTDSTLIYNINNSTTTTTEHPGYPHSPNLGPKPISYTTVTHSPNSAPHSGPTTRRYFYKESTNTINTVHGGPGVNANNQPNEPYTGPKKSTLTSTRPIGGYPPNGGVSYPPNGNSPPAGTVTYHYSSSTTNTNSNRRGPDYGTPSLHPLPPAPFPIDGVKYPAGNGNPPQRVEELMQSFSNTDVVDRTDLNTPRKREIETAVASPNQQQISPSVNRAGRDVYYPPGHEMMLSKREEMHAGSQGGGRWAKGSGMYEYESGYKSKSKTKTSGAMVPVCLPLCCAMPCSIM